MLTWIRFGTASVWLVFGLIFKVLGLVPRHREIVASVIGEEWATPVTVLVGLAEIGMAAWIMSELRPRWCAVAQTLAIGSMNFLELRSARELLLAPLPMVLANTVFLGLVWYWALTTEARARKET